MENFLEGISDDLREQLDSTDIAADPIVAAQAPQEAIVYRQPFPPSEPFAPHRVTEGVFNGCIQALPDPMFPNPGHPISDLTDADEKDLAEQRSRALRASRALKAFVAEVGFRNRPGHRYDSYGLWRAKEANEEYAWLLKEWKRRGIEPPSDDQLREWARGVCGPGFPDDADVNVHTVEIKEGR